MIEEPRLILPSEEQCDNTTKEPSLIPPNKPAPVIPEAPPDTPNPPSMQVHDYLASLARTSFLTLSSASPARSIILTILLVKSTTLDCSHLAPAHLTYLRNSPSTALPLILATKCRTGYV